MAFTLGAGEQIVFDGHPSWRAILGFYIKGLLVTAAIALLVVLYGNTIGDEVSAAAVTIVILAGAAITLLAGFVKRVATRYTITNRRLHIKRGIVSREVQETRLERVQDVSYRQTVYQRLMQIGDVDFDTASHDQSNFVFAGVGDPGEVVEEVHKATVITGGPSGLGGDGRES